MFFLFNNFAQSMVVLSKFFTKSGQMYESFSAVIECLLKGPVSC